VDIGDVVRVLDRPAAAEAGIAGRTGTVYGVTQPSLGYADRPVVGAGPDDVAYNVHFEELDEGFWIDPGLLEFVDHGAGTTIGIAGATFVRRADGSWESNR
jgi:hypothetical protein